MSKIYNIFFLIPVPGLGGSQFEARLNRSESIHWYCYKHSEWYTLWLSIEQLLLADCLVQNMKLDFNTETLKTQNMRGVEIRQNDFGNTSTVEWLDPFHRVDKSLFSYFYDITDYLVHNYNYTRNVDIRGAPYDFRKAPNEMEYFFNNLTSLIEETYLKNDQKRIILIGHSMGNPYILYFLNQMVQSWKDKYIQSFISISSPWLGSVKTLRLMASGDSLGHSTYVVKPMQARKLQRSMPSSVWLMPSPAYWDNSEILVMSPTANYSAADYRLFFTDIDYSIGYILRNLTENLIKDLVDPGVEVHCLYGYNTIKDTPEVLDYRRFKQPNWYDNQPDVIYGDGDGTVNLKSAQACKKWKNVKIKEFMNAEHTEVLSDKRTLEYIGSVVESGQML